MKLISAPMGNTNPNLKSESLSTLPSHVQQLSERQHDHSKSCEVDIRDSDPVQQTILQYMNIDFNANLHCQGELETTKHASCIM